MAAMLTRASAQPLECQLYPSHAVENREDNLDGNIKLPMQRGCDIFKFRTVHLEIAEANVSLVN